MSQTENKVNTRAARLANWMVDHRLITALVILIPTIILGSSLSRIEVYSKFSDLLPQRHPYIQTYNEMKATFGGANVVTMSLETVKGDIFTNKTLNKIRFLTQQVDLITGVNHYQVASIAHPKIRRIRTTAGGLIKSEPVLPRVIPEDKDKLKQLREEVFNNDIVYGTYVSTDGQAALILAGFDEERLDYRQIYTRFQELKKQVEADGETRLYIAGEPMLKGWIYHYSGQMKVIFAITLGIIVLLLLTHFRSFTGVIIPLIGTAMSSIWGLGLVGWLGYNLDPLVLVVPILISARTASHCVQMMERYQDELGKGIARDQAVRTSMGELLVPASIAIFTDAAGLLVLTVSSIPIIAKLGIFCAFWSFSNIFTVAIMVPLLLTVLPLPRVVDDGSHKHWVAHLMSKWAKFVISPRATAPVLGVTVIIIVGSSYFAKDAIVGENLPGSPILFQDSEYNNAAARINEKFAGSNQFSIYFESEEAHKMKDPEVVRVMEEFAHHMSNVSNYGGTRDIPQLVRSVNRLYHFDDPRWSLIPSTQRDIGNILFMYEAGAAIPGVILEYMDLEARRANFVVFFKDVTGPTVDAAVREAKAFLDAHPLEGVKYRFAGGIVGTTAAANQEVEHSELLQTILIVVVVTLSVMLTYRSVTAALFVFVVLALAVLINRAYMGMRGIGLNVNTLPVTAVGIGIGVDYAIYVLDRIREEVRDSSLTEAIKTTLSTTGSAVFFTAVTVIGGIAYWIPGSALRFNSEMAMLLSLLMLSNMIGSITLLPLLVRIFKPNFVTGSKQRSPGDSEGEKKPLAECLKPADASLRQ
jgi:predicted RND superfamily exporter protein